MTDRTNDDQREFWNARAGAKWCDHQEALDALMQPVLDGVLRRADIVEGQVVLDIGCGAGASSMQVADIVGPQGHVLGLDISETLLERAGLRAGDRGNLSFEAADAMTHPFDTGSFHHLISRFGVMFFSDPQAAFANMARALVPGGAVTFAAWGQIANNPFFTDAAAAARSVLGSPPKTDPDAPGPFAFRDPLPVIDMLGRAGLVDAACDTQVLNLTPRGTLDEFGALLMDIGPVAGAVAHFQATPAQQAEVRQALVAAFAQYETDRGLRLPAEINFFTARAA